MHLPFDFTFVSFGSYC